MKEFKKDYVVFDIETTGLDCCKDTIIEIGALKYINEQLVDEFSVLINPNMMLPQIITQITGITDEDLIGKDTLDIVLPKFLEFIGSLPLVAHNAPFDIGFITEKIKQYDLNPLINEAVDTLVIARKYIPKAYNYKLETLKNYFKINQVSHRAIGDCRTTNCIYEECKKRASKLVSV